MASVKTEMRNSFFWNAVENIARFGTQFVIGVILARLLDASIYGIIGIISVFIAVSQTLIDAGFSNALLQKKDCTNEDYATVFWVNVGVSLSIFAVLYVTAPFIASFYETPILSSVLRVMGISLVIQSLYTVNKTKLTKELKFKKLAFITLAISVVSGLIAILFAYLGFGVWSLVSQTCISIVLTGFAIFYYSKWIPSFTFSKQSFNRLFGFGSKILVSNILYTVFNNIYNLVIGKYFQPSTLGYYTRADGYAKLVPNNVSGILQNIMLPVLSKYQNDTDNLKVIYGKFIKLTSFFIYPMTLLFAVLAKPLILLMLTSKWENSIPILQILCVASLCDHIVSINNSYLMVGGNSSYILRLSASTKVILLLILIISLKWGIIAVAWGKAIYSAVLFIASVYYINKSFSIGLGKVIHLVTPIFIVSSIVCVVAYILNHFLPIAWWSLLTVCTISLLLYLFMAKRFLKDEVSLVKSIK